jgi:hypothetical protein
MVTCGYELNRGLAKALLLVVVACTVLAEGCSKGPRQQSEALDDKSRVTLTDAWILEHTPELLQVRFCYEGVDPNRSYNLSATVRGDKEGSGRGGGWIKQIPIPSGTTKNQFQVIWEFLGFPRETANIYFTLEFKDKESGLARSVDFKLPGSRHLRTRKMGSQ